MPENHTGAPKPAAPAQLLRSKKCALLLLLGVFLFMWVCNTFTLEVADDFTYHFSFRTKERITNVFQIFPSMLSHAKFMNGRTVAHFWAQLFEMLPKWIFNLVNSAVFTLQIGLLCRIGTMTAHGETRRNNALIVIAFSLIWLFQPAFGQVNLWLDGACNYLWAGFAGLAFLLPFVREYLSGKSLHKPWHRVLLCIFGFFCGAHSENGSAAVIFMAMLLVLLGGVFEKRRPSSVSIWAMAAAVLGYITIYLSPAELSKKGSELNLITLRRNFVDCLNMLKSVWLLLGVAAVLFALACLCRVERRHLILAAVFATGALAGNFIMAFASYYEKRSAFCVIVFLVCAVLILANQLWETKHKTLLCCALAVCLLPTSYHMMVGANDIYEVYCQMKANETHIYACREQGIMDIEIGLLRIKTGYCAPYALKYVDASDPETWPNDSMARYYGVNSIIGKHKDWK